MMVSVGDLARSLLLTGKTTDTKERLDRLVQEMSSGEKADFGKAMHGNLSPILAIKASMERLDTWTLNAQNLERRLGALEATLGALDGLAMALADDLMRASESHQPETADLAGKAASSYLETALDLLNTRSGEVSIFAGQRLDQPAVLDKQALMTAIAPALVGVTTAEGVKVAVEAFFHDPAGFEAQIYLGSQAVAPVHLGLADSLSQSVTALDPALRELLAGLTTAAMLEEGLPSASPASRRELALVASEMLYSNSEARVKLAAHVGQSQAHILRVVTQNSNEVTSLRLALDKMVGADPEATASDLESTRVQLEMIYALTARLSGLSLLSFMK